MSFSVKAQNLGKSYVLRHEQRARYNTLRDSVVQGVSGFFKGNLPKKEQEIFWALNGIDLEIAEGERVGIIGHNGAGKSTLLKVLSRLTEPTTGEVRIRGKINGLLEVNTGFHPELTGRENIYLKGAIHGMGRAEINQKFDSIVDFSGVEKFLDTPVKFYSSGMYVRLAFSVAAHLEPDILVVDEVLAVGDASFQQKCMGRMGETAQAGRTVLFVSHNMPAVRSLCSRAVVLNAGKVVFDGPANDAVNFYMHSLGDMKAEQVWENTSLAPGNALYRFDALRVRGHDGRIISRLPNDKSFTIETDYTVLKSETKVGVTILVTNYEGEILFSSISNHEPDWHQKPRPEGRYRSSCKVPGDLLREGPYRITAILWSDGYLHTVSAENAVFFEVFDTGTLRGDYFGGWGGSIKPRLEWHCNKLSEADL